MTCTYAQQSTPLLVGPNTIITSLENKDDTQNLFGSPKIEKKWKIYMSWKKLSQKWHILGCRFRTLSTQNRYLDFPDTKTPLPTIFYYHLCSNHRIWSQSAHKRPRNCQNSYFFSNCPCTLRPQKDPNRATSGFTKLHSTHELQVQSTIWAYGKLLYLPNKLPVKLGRVASSGCRDMANAAKLERKNRPNIYDLRAFGAQNPLFRTYFEL